MTTKELVEFAGDPRSRRKQIRNFRLSFSRL
jgi:hypothetical protein